MLKIERVVAAVLVGVIASAAAAQDAVQWRVEDGGNGHWYRTVADPERLSWGAAQLVAEEMGGHLPTAATQEEWAYLINIALVGLPAETWVPLGIFQQPDAREPAGGWAWLDGPGIPIPWGGPNPNNVGSGENFGHGRIFDDGIFAVNDYSGSLWSSSQVQWIVTEWSADCNGDGIVDYGQILDGTFADEDGNGVPDCCEPVYCSGDLNGDDAVGPPDLGILLAVWGTDGGKIDNADLNGDGTVNAADLGLLIGAWGQCGCN